MSKLQPPSALKSVDPWMSNSYAKRSISSSALTMQKQLPLNGAKVKPSNQATTTTR
jgi:hypothetical protein